MKNPIILLIIFAILIYLNLQTVQRQALFEGEAEVTEDIAFVNDYIHATVTLINRGFSPDRDGILITWIEGPEGKKFREKKEVFSLVPVTCITGEYDWDTDTCSDGSKAHKTVITREITLPKNTDIGDWTFKAEYETGLQPLIELKDKFEVKGYNDTFIITVLILLIIFYLRKKQ